MNYEIRHFDTTLLKFSATEDTNSPEIEILWIDDEKKHLLPIDMKDVSGDSLYNWLKHRTIPKNRAYVHNFLSKCGLNINRPMNIIKVSKGLSLNDCYWVVEDGFEGKFDAFNLYENKLSKILALIAFTGYGSSVRTSLASCPEFTTNGMLPKCWRRDSGKIKLYKGGTKGASNTGNEPYSEFYAAQIAKVLGINTIDYTLSKWQGELCSVCDLFTSKEYSFVPVGRIVTTGGMKKVEEYYEGLGNEFVEALHDMFVLDAIIMNTDRHFGNFGFLVDNKTNEIVKPAPLFDHGNSLFNYATEEDTQSKDALNAYAQTLLPCVYDDFMEMAKRVCTLRHKDGLRKLTNFKFEKHPRYNLPPTRLKRIEEQVRARAAMLLEG